ncbi:MAG: FAD:protein FMN transferase [Bacilli bacterium]
MLKKLSFILIFLFLFSGCTKIEKEYSKNFFYMNTYINIKIYSNKDNIDMYFNKIDDLYSEFHKLSDAYVEYKGVKNIYYINNKLKVNEKLEINSSLYKLIEYGINSYKLSDGKVNIALGNITSLWKKYRDEGTGIPTKKELVLAGKNINIDDIVLEDNTILKKSNINIDLGAIAKGYVTELVGNYLESVGINNYLINAGGNVKTGNHYNKGLYKIGIEEPIKDSDNMYKIVNVTNQSVITSGSYERYYEYDDKLYHHIIDSKTLYPSNNMKSVTIITKDSGYGDLLSTMLFLMSIEDGIKYVNNLSNVEAIWYSNDNNVYYSDGFDKYE